LSNPDDALAWVRAPQQARSQATLIRFLDAAEELLDEVAFDSLSVQVICERAESSVGAFYARFADKTALLHVLHERLCDEAKATVGDTLDAARWRGVPLADIIRGLVGFIVVEYGHRQGLRRELVRRNGTDPAFRIRSVDVAAVTVDRLTHLLVERRAELNPEREPASAAEFINRLIFGVLDQDAVFADTGPAGVVLGREILAEGLTSVVLAWLGTPAAPPAPTGPPAP